VAGDSFEFLNLSFFMGHVDGKDLFRKLIVMQGKRSLKWHNVPTTSKVCPLPEGRAFFFIVKEESACGWYVGARIKIKWLKYLKFNMDRK
jgi:hypothetical protein